MPALNICATCKQPIAVGAAYHTMPARRQQVATAPRYCTALCLRNATTAPREPVELWPAHVSVWNCPRTGEFYVQFAHSHEIFPAYPGLPTAAAAHAVARRLLGVMGLLPCPYPTAAHIVQWLCNAEMRP